MDFRSHLSVPIVAAALVLAACQGGEPAADSDGAAAGGSQATEPGAVQVTAKDFEFQAPREIASGWNRFRFVNEGEQEHFFILYRLPDGKSLADYKAGVTKPFIEVWNRYEAGELTREEVGPALGEELAPWFFTDVTTSGGAGITEPGRTSRVALDLQPGTYVMECYVKTPQGTWHNDRGMLREITVTADSTGLAAPEADAELTISNYALEAPDSMTPGSHTVAVHVADTPDGFMPHDINLFRLAADTTTVDQIVAWMDWMDLDQFRAPAPGVSLGGVKSMPAGSTAYVTVELEPGRYAWVSENYAPRGVMKEFTVE